MNPLTPLEFYAREFKLDFSIVEQLKDKKLFSLNSMTQFTELYVNYLNKFNKNR